MSVDITTEKRFEEDIEASFLSPAGGYTKNNDAYDTGLGLFKDTLIRFVQKTQPNEWKRFTMQNAMDPERKFCLAFNTACDMDGLVTVMRHGFKHRGITFRVCYFRPESSLNQTATALYAKNEITVNRQWFYSTDSHNSVDMVIAVNGIPVFAFELKNQYTGQTVDNAKRQWMYDRDPREICFQFNKRILGFFCVDQLEAWMTTKELVEAFDEETEKEDAVPVFIPKASEVTDTPEISVALGKYSDAVKELSNGRSSALRVIAQSEGLLVEALVDKINEIAVEIIGDILIEDNGDGYTVIEDYADML